MKTVKIDLENCYGIKKLQTDFDFSQQSAYAIYAPNGSMKSSLAQTFKDEADAIVSKDRIFPTRVCSRKITDENNVNLPKESILVIRPYDEVFGAHRKNLNTVGGHKGDPDFVKLTSLLHWKGDSANITQSDLDSIYHRVFGGGAEASRLGRLARPANDSHRRAQGGRLGGKTRR